MTGVFFIWFAIVAITSAYIWLILIKGVRAALSIQDERGWRVAAITSFIAALLGLYGTLMRGFDPESGSDFIGLATILMIGVGAYTTTSFLTGTGVTDTESQRIV